MTNDTCDWCGNLALEDHGCCDTCKQPHHTAEINDHCGECGQCFDHCSCDGGPNPHVRALLAG